MLSEVCIPRCTQTILTWLTLITTVPFINHIETRLSPGFSLRISKIIKICYAWE